jgi:hypothetical protein
MVIMRLALASGSLSSGSGLIGAGLAMVFPDQRVIGAILIGFGIITLFLDIKLEDGHLISGVIKNRFRHLGRRIILVIIVAAMAIAWWFWYFIIPVYPPFLPAYSSMQKLLGTSTRPAVKGKITTHAYGGAFQSLFDNAMVIWLDNPGMIYAIPIHNPDGRVTIQPDTNIASPDKWPRNAAEEAIISRRLGLPSDCKPPLGGILEHSENFKWIGCRKWAVGVDDATVYSQEFEHGIITGVWREDILFDGGQVFVIFKDTGKWELRHSQEKAPTINFQY